ncbi:hypothetical protein SCALM49S_00725 [Streptomyces californicus]
MDEVDRVAVEEQSRLFLGLPDQGADRVLPLAVPGQGVPEPSGVRGVGVAQPQQDTAVGVLEEQVDPDHVEHRSGGGSVGREVVIRHGPRSGRGVLGGVPADHRGVDRLRARAQVSGQELAAHREGGDLVDRPPVRPGNLLGLRGGLGGGRYEVEDEPEVVVLVCRFALGGVGVDGVDVDVGGLVAERRAPAERLRRNARLLLDLAHSGRHQRGVLGLDMAAGKEPLPAGGVVPNVQHPSVVVDHGGAARDVPGNRRPGGDLAGSIEGLHQRAQGGTLTGVTAEVGGDEFMDVRSGRRHGRRLSGGGGRGSGRAGCDVRQNSRAATENRGGRGRGPCYNSVRPRAGTGPPLTRRPSPLP